MTEPNPYAAPQASPQNLPDSQGSLGELVKGWEKQRLVYNGLLFVPGTAVLAIGIAHGQTTVPQAIVIALLLGGGANAAFFLGPLAELYLRVIFFRSKPAPMLRRLLLIGGFLISFGAMALYGIGQWIGR